MNEFESILGLSFTDWEGKKRESWQLVNKNSRSAFAILDTINGKQDRFLFADSVEDKIQNWRKEILAKYEQPVIIN